MTVSMSMLYMRRRAQSKERMSFEGSDAAIFGF